MHRHLVAILKINRRSKKYPSKLLHSSLSMSPLELHIIAQKVNKKKLDGNSREIVLLLSIKHYFRRFTLKSQVTTVGRIKFYEKSSCEVATPRNVIVSSSFVRPSTKLISTHRVSVRILNVHMHAINLKRTSDIQKAIAAVTVPLLMLLWCTVVQLSSFLLR